MLKTDNNMTRISFALTTILTLTAMTIFGQTVIEEKKQKFVYKNYNDCYSENWNLITLHLTASSPVDIRNTVNDSITIITSSILADSSEYLNDKGNYLNPDCDTTDISFTSPQIFEMRYLVGRNTKEFLSFDINVNWVAGGIGNGFGTSYYAFNLDLINNNILSIHSLFDSTNAEKLREYIHKNIETGKIESPNEGFSTDDGFNIFGKTGEGYGSFDYLGFLIHNNFIFLQYSYDYGRGNGINSIKLPLSDIKKFINKKYRWVCETNKK